MLVDCFGFVDALTIPSQRPSTCMHRIGRTRSDDAGVQVSVRAAPDAGGVGEEGEHTRRHPVATGELWKTLRMSWARSCREGVCRAILICSAALDKTAFYFCLFFCFSFCVLLSINSLVACTVWCARFFLGTKFGLQLFALSFSSYLVHIC